MNILLLTLILFLKSTSAQAEVPFEMTQVGRFHARGLWHKSPVENAPAVVLIPGSGPGGPEEAVPGKLTLTGKDTLLFVQLAQPFADAGFNILLLGKPGVEYHTSFDPTHMFYDLDLYKKSRWQNLIENLSDGITFLKNQPTVDRSRIYALGHSEATQVISDYALANRDIKGLILLGYAGASMASILDWQLYHRYVDNFVATDVDSNHDGYVSRAEAALWPGDFRWQWAPGQNRISYQEIFAWLHANPELAKTWNSAAKSMLYSDGVFTRAPIVNVTAEVPQDVYVFNGALDLQTRPQHSLELAERCRELHKKIAP